MKPKTRKLLKMCVEDGVEYGYARAHKHQDNLEPRQIEAAIVLAVMSQIWEWFDMEAGDD